MVDKKTYTTILHGPRSELKITLSEYCIADIINRVAKPVCRMDEKDIGEGVGLSRATTYRSIRRLELLGILTRVDGGFQATEKWLSTVENIRLKMRQNPSQSETKNLKVRQPSIYNKETNNNRDITASPFDLSFEIKKLKESSQRHIILIGEFLEEIGFQCSSKAAFDTTFRRHLKDAAALSKFTDSEIGRATDYAMKEYKKIGYTLGTLLKIITSNLYAKK